MPLPRPVVSSSLCLILAALVASSSAGAADSLPAPPEARFVTSEAGRLDHQVVPSYAGRCQPSRRCGEGYVFAATRGLRQSGIDPAVAVVLAPATLVVDAVF